MEKTHAYIAVAVVVILLVAGAGAYIVYSGNDDDQKIDKVYHEYDMSKGWGSWDPLLTTTSSSQMTGSAYLANVADRWYEAFYGESAPYDEYTIDDVPDDFLSYDSIVSYNSEGKLVIQATARDNGVYTTKEVVFNELPDYIICAASFACTIYTIIATAHGTEYEDYDDAVLKELDELIYAGDSGLVNRFTQEYGIPDDKLNAVQLGSATNPLKYREQYVDVLESISSEGSTCCFIGSGTSMGWTGGGDWLTEMTAEIGSNCALFNIASIPTTLAAIEAIAHIIGYGDQAQEIVDDIRLKLYACSQGAAEQESKYSYVRSAMYINVDENNARGKNTLADEMFQLFHLRNTATHSGNQTISEEAVIEDQPDIIVFVSRDDISEIDLNQALRVRQS